MYKDLQLMQGKNTLMLIQFTKWYIYQQRLNESKTKNTALKIKIHLRRILQKLYRYKKFANIGTFFIEKLMQIQNYRIDKKANDNTN